MAHAKITISDLAAIFRDNLLAGWHPMILLGKPGAGKSTITNTLLRSVYAEHLGVQIDDIGFNCQLPASRDAQELTGPAVPMRDESGKVAFEFSVPPVINEIAATGKKYGVLLVDEIANCRDPEQKVFGSVFNPADHSIGGHKLPAGWIVIGTGNRASDKTGAARLLSMLTNRAQVYELDFDFPSFRAYCEMENINPLMIDCAAAYHEQGFFADSVPAEDGAFCTPRSFEKAARIVDVWLASPEFSGHMPRHIRCMIESCIGISATATLSTYVSQAGKVPTADEIMACPESCLVPAQTGFQLLAGNGAISAAVTEESGEKALQYIVRLRPDLQVSLGTKLLQMSARKSWVLTSGLANQFIAKFHDLIPLASNAGWK